MSQPQVRFMVTGPILLSLAGLGAFSLRGVYQVLCYTSKQGITVSGTQGPFCSLEEIEMLVHVGGMMEWVMKDGI